MALFIYFDTKPREYNSTDISQLDVNYFDLCICVPPVLLSHRKEKQLFSVIFFFAIHFTLKNINNKLTCLDGYTVDQAMIRKSESKTKSR